MYSVIVSDEEGVRAKSIKDGLAEAVSFGRRKSLEGNRITVYEAVQESNGEILHLNKVISMVMPKETPYV